MVFERVVDKRPELALNVLKESIYFATAKRTAKNRFLKAAMSERMASYVPSDAKKNGIPSRELINVFQKWGVGGWGVVVTGNMQVDPRHLENGGNVIISRENDSEELRQGLRDIAKGGKKNGALLLAQISHAGRQTPMLVNPTPYGPSDLQLIHPVFVTGKPIPLTKQLIRDEVVERFAYCAKVLYETGLLKLTNNRVLQGFDGVQLHGAMGYLISSFLTPSTNTRTDEYGGDALGRSRLAREIYEAIRRKVPASTGFIVGIKMNSAEFHPKGLETTDAALIAAEFERIGFDFIELTGGTYEALGFDTKRESTIRREAFFLEFSDQICKAVKNIPIYVTGGFRTGSAMAQAVLDGSCQGVGIGRFACGEPDLASKFLELGVRGAPNWKFDPDNFLASMSAAGVMLNAMSRQSLSQVGGVVTADIPDFSRVELIPSYFEQMQQYFGKVGAAAKAGQILMEKFHYVEPEGVSSVSKPNGVVH